MKNFYQYLAPFAPDYSGAVAVLYETKALIVILDPGGCSGNVCGYDEPRFYSDGGAIYSAALRDMDTILGDDKKLVSKIVSASEYGDFELIALVGTPVVSVIATDLEALAYMIEKESGIRTISVDTNGMELYDVGEKKARKVLERNFPGKYAFHPTPLDSMPDETKINSILSELEGTETDAKILIVHQKDAISVLQERLNERGFTNVIGGSFFKGAGIRFDDEELFIEECMKYDVIIADPLYFRALKGFAGKMIGFAHLAVSGDLFME